MAPWRAHREPPNIVMFVVGLAMALFAGGLLMFTDVESAPVMTLSIMGIAFIAVSGARPFGR